MSIKIRLAKPSDRETICEFNINMAKETEGKELDTETAAKGVKNLFKHPEYGFYVVAGVNSRIIGSLMVTFEWSDWRNGLYWWIQSVYVKPEFRRQGVYGKMYDFVKDRAGQNPQVCGLRLYVEKNNRKAQSVYKSLGMKETPYIIFEESGKKLHR